VRVHVFPCLQDNYGVLLHDPLTGDTAAIDAPAEAAVKEALAATGWQLTQILVTHSHADHIAGIPGLVAAFGCKVTAPEKARSHVPGADRYVREGDRVEVGGLTGVVLETPGHCADHIAYHFAREKVAFVGDVLFALGCGRVFDEQYDAMWASLRKIAALPPATELYFGHEYTLSNGKFALAVDPGNADLKAQVERAETVRARGDFTIPTTVAAERAANPFLRAVLPGMAAQLGMPGAPAAAVFRELRERKNRF
jgi:hydroxyacylglutathione hydrolase